jgi:hypothetical protein
MLRCTSLSQIFLAKELDSILIGIKMSADNEPGSLAVHTYEIRILKRQPPSTSVHSTTQISDFAAVRTAQKIADAEDTIEVWKGMECIYTGPAQTAPPVMLPGTSRGIMPGRR